MLSANVLVQNCDLSTKKIGSMGNKMFKMGDGYLNDYNTQVGEHNKSEHLQRNYLNMTFDAFKRKKDAAISSETMRASIASENPAQ